MVEFALAIPLLLIVVFAIIEFSFYFHTRMTLRHSVMEASRFAVTGNVMAEEGSGEALSRTESIVRAIQESAYGLRVDVKAIEIDPADGGGPQDVVRIGVTYQYELTIPFVRQLLPGSPLEFKVTTAMKNEPFRVE